MFVCKRIAKRVRALIRNAAAVPFSHISIAFYAIICYNLNMHTNGKGAAA